MHTPDSAPRDRRRFLGAAGSGAPGLLLPTWLLWLLVAVAPCRTGLAQAPVEMVPHAPGQGPRSVVDLQPFRLDVSGACVDVRGRRGTAVLTDLHAGIHVWYLLQLMWEDGRSEYHLETAGRDTRLELDPSGEGLVVVTGRGRAPCPLWRDDASGLAAVNPRRPYTTLCDGQVYARTPTPGHKTSREWATDFLRDYVPGGEQITTFVRGFYTDRFASTADVTAADGDGQAPRLARGPAPPRVDEAWTDHAVPVGDLGLELDGAESGEIRVGRWYATRRPGVFAAAMQPRLVAADVVDRQRPSTNPLDDVESAAMVYLVAFDLQRHDVGFALGTEHPRLKWSDRVVAQVRDPSLPGPDGIGTAAPLVRTGMLPPALAEVAVATFTGGFKRFHGAFRRGELALRNAGSHYGFVESGVVFSRLQPGLATAVVRANGDFDLLTWTAERDTELARIRHARQNGVPLIEPDPVTGEPRVGALVRVREGNWSGSVDGRYRTVRAGIGLQEVDGRRFLLYAYFSAATASAMARVFDAYRCRYAMLTDMNALEHTYLALYRREPAGLRVEHLVRGMEVLDKSTPAGVVPRFLGFSDNRDFFYLYPKTGARP